MIGAPAAAHAMTVLPLAVNFMCLAVMLNAALCVMVRSLVANATLSPLMKGALMQLKPVRPNLSLNADVPHAGCARDRAAG